MREIHNNQPQPTAQLAIYETHSHTQLCRHAEGDPTDYAQVAWERGFRGLAVTCHNPMPNGFGARVRMAPDEFPRYVDLVDQAREVWGGRVDVLLGLECDFFPGYESWLEDQLTAADFQYVIGSIHPQLAEYRRAFWSDDALECQRTYFELLAQAAETKLFDCLAHPDFVKNEMPEDWAPEKIGDDIRRSLDRIAATGVAMEYNTSGLNKPVQESGPCSLVLREMAARQIPVVVGSDAHVPSRVGDGFADAFARLRDYGYDRVGYFVERRRVDVPLGTLSRMLASRSADDTVAIEPPP